MSGPFFTSLVEIKVIFKILKFSEVKNYVLRGAFFHFT